ncbi:MAG: hypothetical protein A2622_01490 [Bdellovibrionales bacterium RIFCSPHIGHO2_01_FULL_40_29]|nr:MAG: hypothetical protein A2622_01490 [Bdellovibrionales bacterium RIFCSPHIGHO2_01_FULL_40_29]OFZ33771.1 MAG: hypothetical protein A3D17_01910 [Bdellovibrionales bacterium RIFCSPHIGHO2_02_FULL_40_15]
MIKKLILFFSFCITATALISCTDSSGPYAASHFTTNQLMTAQDAVNSASSNISITNAAGAAITASGLYIASYDINDCSACYGSLYSGNNTTGALVESVSFEAGQSIEIGQNYLYNLLYSGISVMQLNGVPPPCQLPGCSWSGDTPMTGWCLTLGVMSRNSAYTFSSYTNGSLPAANVVPFGQAVTSIPFNYKFDLIDPLTLGAGNACLGPIVCDDRTLNCSVSSRQNQSFQVY